jgi:hypothetical protein
MQSRPGSRVVLQVAGTVAAAVIVVAVFANLRSEPSPVPAGESTQVRGIAASELRRDVVSPTPTAPAEKPIVAADAKREARKPAPRKPHEPAAAKVATVEPAAVVEPGLPPPPPTPVEDSFVSAAGKTSLAVLRTSTDFVTSTVPKAVVSTTRDALGKAKSFGTAVLDKVTP